MSYDSEVLADSPLAYWRLDELSGTVAADSSGNNRHATILTFPAESSIPVVYGVPAPIETDSVNRGMSGGVAHAPVDVALDTTGDFTLEVWGFTGPESAETAVLLTRATTAAGSGGTSIRISGQTITARLRLDSTGSTNWEVSYGNQLEWMTWFYIAVVRNSNVLQLTINDALVDQRTDLPTDTVTLAEPNWGISATPAGVNNAESWGVARPAIYGTALSTARRLVHYEAAINATFLRGYSNVVPSAILYSAEEPDPIEFPLRHNWSEPLSERISFRTNLSRARRGQEEGAQVRSKPRREIEISQVLRDNTERRKLRAQLWANQNRKWFVPILEDREQLTAPLSAGTTEIPVSTLYKDYEAGSYIGLRQLNDVGAIIKSETLQIVSFTSSTVTVAAIVNDYAAYLSSAYPVRRGLITPSSIQGHTDTVEEVTITAWLLAEDESAVPNRIIPWTPTLKYRDMEVFDPAVWQSHDWSERREYESQRQLDELDFADGIFGVESDTAGAEEIFTYRITLKGREGVARLLGWFYERAGALNYLWVASMQSDFEIVSVLGSTVTVVETNYSDSYALAEARRDLAFVYHDNTMEFRRVLSFAGEVNETLTLDAVVPTLTNLRSVSLLKFCRLDADTVEIAKVTDDVWRFAWRFRELLHSPEGTGLSSLSPSASVSPSQSASPSA